MGSLWVSLFGCGFVSVWEAFGCVVLKDAAGMRPKPLAALVGEGLLRLLRAGRAAGFDALAQCLRGKGAVATCGESIPEQQPVSRIFTLKLLECGWSFLGLVCGQSCMDFKQRAPENLGSEAKPCFLHQLQLVWLHRVPGI